jgi:multisubunit Na+/H+ antiporter MnhB subunit
VEHPVTAVLLNIRSYDTWLELVVLLLGLIGVIAVRGGRALPPATALPRAGDLLVGLVRILVPAMVMVAGYLLWLGKYDAGGAFQAGVVLGVALVLLWYGGFPSAADLPAGVLRLGLASGVIGFLFVALTTIVGGDVMLELPPPYAGGVIVVIETLATVSIGLTVGCLVLGLQPERS